MFVVLCFMFFVRYLMLLDSSFSSLVWVIVSLNVLKLKLKSSIFMLVINRECVCVLFCRSSNFLGSTVMLMAMHFIGAIENWFGSKHCHALGRAGDCACISTVWFSLLR